MTTGSFCAEAATGTEASAARGKRPSSCSATAATTDQSSRLHRWLGWRILPTARPGRPLVAMKLRGRGLTHAAFLGMGGCSSNSAYVGYPLAAQVLGPVAAVGLALCMLVENLLVIPLGLAMAEAGGPMKTSPAAAQACAKASFSLRKP